MKILLDYFILGFILGYSRLLIKTSFKLVFKDLSDRDTIKALFCHFSSGQDHSLNNSEWQLNH